MPHAAQLLDTLSNWRRLHQAKRKGSNKESSGHPGCADETERKIKKKWICRIHNDKPVLRCAQCNHCGFMTAEMLVY